MFSFQFEEIWETGIVVPAVLIFAAFFRNFVEARITSGFISRIFQYLGSIFLRLVWLLSVRCSFEHIRNLPENEIKALRMNVKQFRVFHWFNASRNGNFVCRYSYFICFIKVFNFLLLRCCAACLAGADSFCCRKQPLSAREKQD